MPVQLDLPTATKEKISIGSDPELAICSKTLQTLEADTFIEDGNRSNEFGLDGCSSTAEIRPAPSFNPIEHVENIKRILVKYSKNPFYKKAYGQVFMPSVMERGIGGHIHIGHRSIANIFMLSGSSANDLKSFVQYNLVPTLDMLLAVPVMFVENPQHARQRKLYGGYGKPGDFRWKDYGIEYRTLSSWIGNEKLAKAVVSLAYSISYDVLEKKYSAYNLFESIPNFYDHFMNHNLRSFRPMLPIIYDEIHKLTLFKDYKKFIEYLLVNAEKEKCLYKKDIKIAWKIPYLKVRKAVLYSILTLIRKMIQTLPIVNTLVPTQNIPFIRTVGNRSEETDRTRENINRVLNYILDEKHIDSSQEYGRVNLDYAYHSDFRIYIHYDERFLTEAKANRMVRLIGDAIHSFGFHDEVRIQLDAGFRSDHSATMGLTLSKGIFDEGHYLPEILTFICLLYANNAIYRSYKVSKKTGKKVGVTLLTRQLVKPLEKIAKPARVAREKWLKKVTPIKKELKKLYKEREAVEEQYRLAFELIGEEDKTLFVEKKRLSSKIDTLRNLIGEQKKDDVIYFDDPVTPIEISSYEQILSTSREAQQVPITTRTLGEWSTNSSIRLDSTAYERILRTSELDTSVERS